MCIIASMTPTFSAMWWSRLTALLGAVLLLVGIVPFYIDLAVHVGFDFIQDHYATFGWIGIAGTILAFAGCIGWARFCDRSCRIKMATVVFSVPWAGLIIGSLIDGVNVHGTAALTMALFVPSIPLAAILLIMAAVGQNKM